MKFRDEQNTISAHKEFSTSWERQKSKAMSNNYKQQLHSYYGGAELGITEESHVAQVMGIKKGFLEEVTFDMSLEG